VVKFPSIPGAYSHRCDCVSLCGKREYDQSRAVKDTHEPHLSVIAVSRNDDHGGDLRGRMQHFVEGFIAQCRRHGLNAELVLVEWNPPPDRPSLADSLDWPRDFGPASVRLVTVPTEIHARFAHASKLPLFQMIGKNVGIRCARGRFVLATNIDILLDDATVQYLRDRLRSGTMLRIDRYDVPGDLPRDTSFDRVLAHCARSFFCVNMRLGVFDVRQRRILGLGTGVTANILHLIAELRILGLRQSRLWRCLPRATARVLGAAKAIGGRLQRFGGLLRSPRLVFDRLLAGLTAAAKSAAQAAGRYARKVVPLRRLPFRLYALAQRMIVRGTCRLRTGIARRLSRLRRLGFDLASYLTGGLDGTTPAAVRYRRSRWLHTNGCGDFTVLARDDWARLRGYPEWPIFSWHLDSAFMYAASAHDIKEVALNTGYRIYHIDHSSGSGWSPSGAARLFARLDAKGIPYLSNHDLELWRRKVAMNPQSAIVNGPDWGLGGEPLPERQIMPRRSRSLRQGQRMLSTCS
jgi:hypothetical protein